MLSMHPSVTLDRVMDAVKADDNRGICIDCGADMDGVEPDARQYHCGYCGLWGVYGAEELLIMMA